MNAKQYIDSLFSEYEESVAMNDFKEELMSNLEAHVSSLKAKGLNDFDAFRKATAELGDITTLANQISLKKKQEVYETMYMKTSRSYITPGRRAAYITCLGAFLFGALSALMLNEGTGILIMIPFGILPIGWFIYLLLTQETARLNPMRKGRACIYSIVVAIFTFSLVLFMALYSGAGLYSGYTESRSAFAVLIPFGLPSVLALVYLAITEKTRTKAWVTNKDKQ